MCSSLNPIIKMQTEINVQLPKWGESIFESFWTYWFLYGGRGSAKTQTIATGLVLRAAEERLRIVCFRAVQNNVDESVRQELVDAIYRAGLEADYDIKEKYIRHRITRSQFTFRGMQKPGNLRGLAGVSIIWCDEAQDIPQKSLRALTPSIRQENAQLIFTFNPISAEDAVWRFMQLFHNDPRAIIMKKNWRDNPWFPEKLNQDRMRDLQRDPMEYQHIWEGEFWQRSDALVMLSVCELDLVFDRPAYHETDDGRFYLGADFGFSADPNVLTFGWIKDGYFWIEYAEFQYGVELPDIEKMYDRVPGSRDWPILGDAARPDIISMLRNRGFNIEAAPKGPGSVEDGITFLRSFKGIKIHKRCVKMAEEAMKYSYKVDPRTDQVLPVLVDDYNHGFDSCRYSLSMLAKSQQGMVFSEADLAELEMY